MGKFIYIYCTRDTHTIHTIILGHIAEYFYIYLHNYPLMSPLAGTKALRVPINICPARTHGNLTTTWGQTYHHLEAHLFTSFYTFSATHTLLFFRRKTNSICTTWEEKLGLLVFWVQLTINLTLNELYSEEYGHDYLYHNVCVSNYSFSYGNSIWSV